MFIEFEDKLLVNSFFWASTFIRLDNYAIKTRLGSNDNEP